MTKRFTAFAVFAFMLLTELIATNFVSAQELKMEFVDGAYPVNRIDNIVWVDIKLSNTAILKDLKFNVNLSFQNDGNPTVRVIPAYCLDANGNNDQSKWTDTTRLGVNTWRFHYWMDPNRSENFLPVNLIPRKIMRFYVKFDSPIPDCGKMTISCTNFTATGVTAQGQEFFFESDKLPPVVNHVVNLGDCPDEQYIINLAANAVVMRTNTINELKLRLDRLNSKAFKTLSFDLTAPSGWNIPAYSLFSQPGDVNFSFISANKWRVTVNTDDPRGFPISLTYTPWLNLTWNFPKSASGVVEFVFNNFRATGVAGDSLLVIKELRKLVDLGPGEPSYNVSFSMSKAGYNWFDLNNYLIDRYGRVEVNFNIDNLEKNVRATSFNISMPSYFEIGDAQVTMETNPRQAIFNLISSQNGINTYAVFAVNETSGYWPPNNPNFNPRDMVKLYLRFIDLPPGNVVFQIRNINAVEFGGAPLNSNKAFDFTINFLPEFVRFKRGDSYDYNFGDKVLNRADLELLGDYIAGNFTTPSLYQLWAFDYNQDGVIDERDWTALYYFLYPNTAVKDGQDNSIMVYPNPSNGQVTISRPEASPATIIIYDLNGNPVSTADLNDSSTNLYLQLSSGYYYYRIITTDKIVTDKTVGNSLIIQK